MASIIGAILEALLGFFQQRREADQTRLQTERLARDAERARVELAKAKENFDVARQREAIDATVRDNSADDAIERLRASVRKRSGS